MKEYKSKVTLTVNEKSADAEKLMAVMGLGARRGMEITVTIEGEDEELAALQIEQFMKEHL